jgi:hypothetical protein
MNIVEAIKYARQGKQIRRSRWRDYPEMWLKLKPYEDSDDMDFVDGLADKQNPFIFYDSHYFSLYELEADDWEVVE